MKQLLLGFVAIWMLAPPVFAGTPDEDPAVYQLYQAYKEGSVPPLQMVLPDTIWHCAYYQAEKGNYYRASTFMKFYKQRKDKVIRSVTRVTYPRRVSATTYYAFTSYGFVSIETETNIYSSIRQTGPNQFVIEHFQARGPLELTAKGFPALTAPGTSFGYSACVVLN